MIDYERWFLHCHNFFSFYGVFKPLRLLNSYVLGGGGSPGFNTKGTLMTIGLSCYQVFDITYEKTTVSGFSGIKIVYNNGHGSWWSALIGTALTVVQ
jgi:hypothetical protein